jgi:dihydropteroate synthase
MWTDEENNASAVVRNFQDLGRCRVMGVVNVTPDSFSDPGAYESPDVAVQAGLDMRAEGADVVDVGGESTRPGAHRVDVAQERRRVLPVVAELASAGVVVSVDTTRAAVAAAALDAGATLINDISCAAERDLIMLVAERGVPYVLVHNGLTIQRRASQLSQQDRVRKVVGELAQRMEFLISCGVEEDQVIIDPGIGFGKEPDDEMALLANLSILSELGRPVMVSASRKSVLGRLLAGPDGTPRPVEAREAATQATTALLAVAGAWAVRVHVVPQAIDAVQVANAWLKASAGQK